MEIPPEISASIARFDQEFPPLAQAARRTLADLRNRQTVSEQRIGSALSIVESGAGGIADTGVMEELEGLARFQEEWLEGYPGIMDRMLERLYDELVILYGHKAIYAKALWDALDLDDLVGEMSVRITFMEGLLDQLPRLAPADAGDIELHDEAIAYTDDVLYVVRHGAAYLMRLKVALWSGSPLPQRTS